MIKEDYEWSLKELLVGLNIINNRVVGITKQGYEKTMKCFSIKLIGFIHEFRRIKGE